jgi:hypothetical protein
MAPVKTLAGALFTPGQIVQLSAVGVRRLEGALAQPLGGS